MHMYVYFFLLQWHLKDIFVKEIVWISNYSYFCHEKTLGNCNRNIRSFQIQAAHDRKFIYGATDNIMVY